MTIPEGHDGTLAADPLEERQSGPGLPGRQATAHEEEKTANVAVGIAGGYHLASRSRAATVGYVGEVREFDVFKVAREGFTRLRECLYSRAS